MDEFKKDHPNLGTASNVFEELKETVEINSIT